MRYYRSVIILSEILGIFFTKNTVLASLPFYCADEYREAFDMDLESCFEAFDSEYGRVGCSSASYSELRFKNASRPMELKWSWKVPPGTYKLRVLRISRSLQRRFESRTARL